MIKSKTKYQINIKDIEIIFEKHGLGQVSEIIPFGLGEFNSVCKVLAHKDGSEAAYVIKISPPEDANVLSYEKDMMRGEVYWYEQISKHTDIPVPEIYLYDDSREIIPVPFFVMAHICGNPLYTYELSDTQLEGIKREKLHMLAQIHNTQGEYFGYYQGEHYDNWYEAISAMVKSLITDCEAIGKETPDGLALLEAIGRHQNILEAVPCGIVHFDLWDTNILFENGHRLVWIDVERCFYGDPIGDLITQGNCQMETLAGKADAIGVYNEFAKHPFSLSEEENIRFAIMLAYLALIEEVEKYVRYEPTDENYIRNTVDARKMYDMAFEIL